MGPSSDRQVTQRTVLLPEPVEEEAVRLLEEGGVELLRAADPRPETVAPLLARADAVVLRTGLKLDAGLLAVAERLRTVSRTGAGYDNVDVPAATARGVIVTSSVGANTSTVVEHTLALLLALAKRVLDLDRAVRQRRLQAALRLPAARPARPGPRGGGLREDRPGGGPRLPRVPRHAGPGPRRAPARGGPGRALLLGRVLHAARSSSGAPTWSRSTSR